MLGMLAGAVKTLVPFLYVHDLAASMAFYELIGFEEVMCGGDGTWTWRFARCGELGLLLAAGDPHTRGGPGPVQLYCRCDDLPAVHERLAAAGAVVEHLGHPVHAPGGELRALDPDGHVLMIADTTGALPSDASISRISLLRRAAEAARSNGEVRHACRVGQFGGARCPRPAEVKLVDSWGDTIWSCLEHGEEILFNVNGAYVATHDSEGLSDYLARRRRPLGQRV
jgi:predicted enzyme related to lactoylglutathione lyase